jgi:hypothetical protein
LYDSDIRIRLPAVARDFLFFLTVQTRSGANSTYEMGKRTTSVGIKGPEREAPHSLPSSVEVKEAFST